MSDNTKQVSDAMDQAMLNHVDKLKAQLAQGIYPHQNFMDKYGSQLPGCFKKLDELTLENGIEWRCSLYTMHERDLSLELNIQPYLTREESMYLLDEYRAYREQKNAHKARIEHGDFLVRFKKITPTADFKAFLETHRRKLQDHIVFLCSLDNKYARQGQHQLFEKHFLAKFGTLMSPAERSYLMFLFECYKEQKFPEGYEWLIKC
jgi:hypothetical protein